MKNDFINTSKEGFAHANDVSAYSFVAISRIAKEIDLLNENASLVCLTYHGSTKVLPNYNIMGVAKAALECSVRYLADNLGKEGIRVNAVSAGPIKTLSAKGIKDFSSIQTVVEEKAPLRRNVTKEEVGNVLKLIKEVYQKDFGFSADSFKYRLSLRDKNNKAKYIDNDEMWETAESQLRAILKEMNIDFYEAEGEAAFYGPKIDIQIKTALNHDVTIPTCQLDFALPERFDLTYVGEDNKEHRPVVIHRAILGSSDRFISFLIEETKGAFPLWLSPIQAKILPITDAQIDYCTELKAKLRAKRIRVELDDSNEKIGYKIRKAQLEKVPYMLVIGANEQESQVVTVRARKNGANLGEMTIDEFIEKVQNEVENKAIDR